MMLNRTHAHALDGAAVFRAIRAALSSDPDAALIDAASEAGGLDTEQVVSRQKLAAAADAAARRWMGRMGMSE